MKSIVRFCLVLTAFTFCTFSGAFLLARTSGVFLDGLAAKPLVIRAANVELQGVRFLNANGKPNAGKFVLFTHGLHSNFHEFEPLARELMAKGFDCYAFNFRGHGNDEEFSSVVNYHDGDYGFDKMAQIDFPAILSTVQEMSGQRGYIVGHSMGGMVPRASLVAGTVDYSAVDGLVLIGSPPHFRSRNNMMESPLTAHLMEKVFEGPGNEPLSASDMLGDTEKFLDIMNLLNPFYWLSKASLQVTAERMKNIIETRELREDAWALRAMTKKIPKDILRSFINFHHEYRYEDARIPVPAFYVVGDGDKLVKADDVIDTAKIQSAEGGYFQVILKGVGHLSLVAPRAVNHYRELLTRFLSDPSMVNSVPRRSVELSPGICERILLNP